MVGKKKSEAPQRFHERAPPSLQGCEGLPRVHETQICLVTSSRRGKSGLAAACAAALARGDRSAVSWQAPAHWHIGALAHCAPQDVRV